MLESVTAEMGCCGSDPREDEDAGSPGSKPELSGETVGSDNVSVGIDTDTLVTTRVL